MVFQLLLAIGAGALSAVIFSSVATGSLLALPLFYLSPLPNYVVGLGWGPSAALVAIISSMLLVVPILGVKAALMHALIVGIPVWIVCYLLSLNRRISGDSEESGTRNIPVAEAISQDRALDHSKEYDSTVQGTGSFVEWYNLGNVITVMAYLAGILSVIGILLVGFDIQSYREEIRVVLERAFQSSIDGNQTPKLDPNILDTVTRLIPEILPAASATIWLTTNLFILWLAGYITRSMGNLVRPWPNIARLDYPKSFGFVFIIALAVSFLPGIPGLASTAFVSAITTAYLVMGLIVIHVLCRKSQYGFYILIMTYFSLIIFPWMNIILAIVGVGEPIFRLRER